PGTGSAARSGGTGSLQLMDYPWPPPYRTRAVQQLIKGLAWGPPTSRAVWAALESPITATAAPTSTTSLPATVSCAQVSYHGGMRIGIGSDESGSDLKSVVITHLREQGHDVVDYGYTRAGGEGAEYSATYARKVAHAIREEDVERGVLICGTGIGISISANKVRGIRAAVCSEPFTARHTRENNGSQIIAFGSFVVGP